MCERERREGAGQSLAQQELLAADRRREHGLQRSLLALAHHRVSGERRGDERRNAQHVQQLMVLRELGGCRCGQREDRDQGLDEEDEREDSHPDDDRALAPVLAELLAEDRPDAPPAHVLFHAASGAPPASPAPFTAPPSLVARSSLLSPGAAAPLRLAHRRRASSSSLTSSR